MGGGRTYSVPSGPSQSTRSAREARTSSLARASPSPTFQMSAARAAVNGRSGRTATWAASSSLKSTFRIWNRLSEGGAPCGNRLSRSVSRS